MTEERFRPDRYDDHPSHPLHNVDPRVLEVARSVLRSAAQAHDVDAEMAEPIADAVVMALLEAGWL